MKTFEKITESLILKAKKANLIHYLRVNHPDSIRYINHPNAPKYYCWRSSKYDSLVFFTEEDWLGNVLYKYHRWSNREQDDAIAYLVKYENYTWPNAVKALAYFVDTIDD